MKVKEDSDEHQGACILFNFFFPDKYPGLELLDPLVVLFLSVIKFFIEYKHFIPLFGIVLATLLPEPLISIYIRTFESFACKVNPTYFSCVEKIRIFTFFYQYFLHIRHY